MILAVDVGNTNIVVGCVSKEKVYFTARISTDRSKTEDQYGIDIKNILELYGVSIDKIKGSIISSVVPPVINPMKIAVQMVTGGEPIVVGPGIKTGLNILMDNPAQLGSDRVADAVAALSFYKPPLIIIDMGTATTISVIDSNKNYIGGCLMPGVKISLDALSALAAQLPSISLEQPKKTIGKNTLESMRSGIINGNASMIDGMIERINEELGCNATVVSTGGIAKYIIPHCKNKIICDDTLLLKGLFIIYDKNKS